jgi:lysophospholipase L1-like esterase
MTTGAHGKISPMVVANRLVGRLLVRQQRMRTSQFGVLPKPAVDVVFLGDSITEYGLWNEWFPRHHVVNRGVVADTSRGVLTRIGTAVGKQDVLSLLIGTNDLSVGVSPGRIADNVAAIIAAVRAADPKTRILLNSVMPRTRTYRGQIIALNQKLAGLAEAEGGSFLDLWPVLADDQGSIRPEFSADQLHLTGAGYAAWVDVLRPHIT